MLRTDITGYQYGIQMPSYSHVVFNHNFTMNILGTTKSNCGYKLPNFKVQITLFVGSGDTDPVYNQPNPWVKLLMNWVQQTLLWVNFDTLAVPMS